MIIRALIIALVLTALLGAAARRSLAGTVVLKSGAEVTGKVVRQRDSVRVENSDGTYTINFGRVESIEGTRPRRRVVRRPARAPEREGRVVVREEKKTYRYAGRTLGPPSEVERVEVLVPVQFDDTGGHSMSIGRSSSYVRGWDTRGDRDEPVVGTIRSGTRVGGGGIGLRFSHRSEPRFRTFSWETEEGERRIHLPTQTRTRVGVRD